MRRSWHRCPEGRDAGQVITTFLPQGQPNGVLIRLASDSGRTPSYDENIDADHGRARRNVEGTARGRKIVDAEECRSSLPRPLPRSRQPHLKLWRLSPTGRKSLVRSEASKG